MDMGPAQWPPSQAEMEQAAARVAADAIAAAEARHTAIQNFLSAPGLDNVEDEWELMSPQTLLYVLLDKDLEEKEIVIGWIANPASNDTASDIWGAWSQCMYVPGGEGQALDAIRRNVLSILTEQSTTEELQKQVHYLADIVMKYGKTELSRDHTLIDLYDWHALLPIPTPVPHARLIKTSHPKLPPALTTHNSKPPTHHSDRPSPLTTTHMEPQHFFLSERKPRRNSGSPYIGHSTQCQGDHRFCSRAR